MRKVIDSSSGRLKTQSQPPTRLQPPRRKNRCCWASWAMCARVIIRPIFSQFPVPQLRHLIINTRHCFLRAANVSIISDTAHGSRAKPQSATVPTMAALRARYEVCRDSLLLIGKYARCLRRGQSPLGPAPSGVRAAWPARRFTSMPAVMAKADAEGATQNKPKKVGRGGGKRRVETLGDRLTSLCKRRGFMFPGSDIYGGIASAWDYGPLGISVLCWHRW